MSFYESAVPYARMGIPCFPLSPKSKLPPSWMTDFPTRATTLLPQLKMWSDKLSDANVGLLGRDNQVGDIAFLEFDQGCLAEAAQDMGQHVPTTRLHISGGKGLEHCVFKQTERSLNLGNRSANKGGKEWFSLRMHNRYVLGPGSIHPDSGKPYTVGADILPIDFPDWLVDWVEKYTVSEFSAAGGKDIPEVSEDFDFDKFREWLPFGISQDGYWYIAEFCPGVNRRHEHSTKTGMFFDGSRLCWKCFAQNCPCAYKEDGSKFTIGDLVRKIGEEVGAYDGVIWPEVPVEYDLEELGIEIVDVMPEVPPDGDGTLPSLLQPPSPIAEAPAADVEDDPLAFPVESLYGVLGEQAKQLNMPLGYAYPAMLAAYSVEPEIHEMCGTRINLYLCVAGNVGSGKNEAMKRAIKMRGLVKGTDYKRSELASNRGLMNLIGERITHKKSGVEKVPGPAKMLVQTNEISTIFKNAARDNSTLFELLCDLWDENDSSVPDRKGTQECDCRLSWVGGLPVRKPDDFSKVFGKQSSFGLHSRFLFAYTEEEWRYSRWEPAVKESLPFEFEADALMPAAECLVLEISPEALKLYEDWYPRAKKADPSGRLSYNLNKVALLTASASHERTVSAECMAKAILFMEWQIRLREYFRPSEANSDSAAFGERVLICFQKHTMRGMRKAENGVVELDWKRIGHDQKWGMEDGGWLYFNTIQNFLRIGELVAIPDLNKKSEEVPIDRKFQTIPKYVRLPKMRQS